MTVLRARSVHCPICDNSFRTNLVESTNAFGGKTTDFRERAAGVSPLPHQIHLCPSCYFCGLDHCFFLEKEGPEILVDHLWIAQAIVPRLSASPSTAEKYEAAAYIYEKAGEDSRSVGDLFLRAAWACVEEKDTEAERYFRKKSIQCFEKALESFDAIESDDKPVYMYLTGELHRRCGQIQQAREWFDKCIEQAKGMSNKQWVADAALQQRDKPEEYFA